MSNKASVDKFFDMHMQMVSDSSRVIAANITLMDTVLALSESTNLPEVTYQLNSAVVAVEGVDPELAKNITKILNFTEGVTKAMIALSGSFERPKEP